MYKLNANKEILGAMIKDYLAAERKSYIEKNSKKAIAFTKEDVAVISKILAEQSNGVGIHVKDIDRAVDEYLMRNNYAYENDAAVALSRQYVAKTEDNYYYYALIELNIFGGARSISEAMYLISQELEMNAKSIRKNPSLLETNKININIVKDNSTKYLKDSDPIRVLSGSYDIEADEVNFKFKSADMSKIYSSAIK